MLTFTISNGDGLQSQVNVLRAQRNALINSKPRAIDAQEYQELVEVMCTDPRAELALDEELDHIDSFEVWSKKVMFKRMSSQKNVNKAQHGDR